MAACLRTALTPENSQGWACTPRVMMYKGFNLHLTAQVLTAREAVTKTVKKPALESENPGHQPQLWPVLKVLFDAHI